MGAMPFLLQKSSQQIPGRGYTSRSFAILTVLPSCVATCASPPKPLLYLVLNSFSTSDVTGTTNVSEATYSASLFKKKIFFSLPYITSGSVEVYVINVLNLRTNATLEGIDFLYSKMSIFGSWMEVVN